MSDKDLIAEARQCHQARGWSKDPLVDKLENLASRLANALEARQVDEAKLAEVLEASSDVPYLGDEDRLGISGYADVMARAVIEFLGERHEPEPVKRPWTRHGHLIPGRIPNEERPDKARCGGVALCHQCKVDAGMLPGRKPAAPQPSESDRKRLIDVLVMTDLSDYAGTDMGIIRSSADEILAAGFSRAAAPAETEALARAWDEGALWRHKASGFHTNGRSVFQDKYPESPNMHETLTGG